MKVKIRNCRDRFRRGGLVALGGKSAEWRSYHHMLGRCYCKTDAKWPRYGGRGITVCERWRDGFENFLADMGHKPPGLTLGRIDNDGNYEPCNCRWESQKEQARNRRTTRLLTFRGETLPASAWADRLGLNPKIVHLRLWRGWPVDKVLTYPVTRTRPNLRADGR